MGAKNVATSADYWWAIRDDSALPDLARIRASAFSELALTLAARLAVSNRKGGVITCGGNTKS